MNIGLQVMRAQNRVLSLIQPEVAVRKAGNLFFTPRRHESKGWEQHAESVGRRMTLKNGASAIVWGEGVPILLMHGWEGRATQMAGFINPLASKGFQLIAIDAPAHGMSDGKQSNPMRFIESMFLAEKAFGSFYAVIGHSMGGGCALYCVSEGLQAEKVVSIAGPASFQRVSKRFASFIGLADHIVEKFVQHVEHVVGIPFEDIDLVSRAPEVTQNVLIVHDSGDEEIPYRDAQHLTQAMPNSHLYNTVGLGHRKIMRSSLVIDTVSNFVAFDNDTFLYEAI